MNPLGKIIILNGTSSSGKSTLARVLQATLTESYLLCSLDAFWDMTPPNLPAGSKNFPNMKLALAKSVKALAITGHNVIVNMIFCGHKTYLELANELEGLNYLIVKVNCALDELQRREIQRGDRKPGLAESQLTTIHTDVIYDLEVDTEKMSITNCSLMIIEYINKSSCKNI